MYVISIWKIMTCHNKFKKICRIVSPNPLTPIYWENVIKNRKNQEAIKEFTKAAQSNRTNSTTCRSRYACFDMASRQGFNLLPESRTWTKKCNHQHNLGLCYYYTGKYEEAISSFRQATTLSPSESKSHYFLAESLFESKRLKEAVAEYEKAVKLSPYNSDYYRELAWASYQNGNNARAIECAKKATELNGKEPAGFFVLGVRYRRQVMEKKPMEHMRE